MHGSNIQHPTLKLSQDPILASLNRWNRQPAPTKQIPLEVTIKAMDVANVSKALVSA